MSHVTNIVISDPDLLAKLASAEGHIIFSDPAGNTVKMAEVVGDCTPPPGVVSPFSDEDVEESRKQAEEGSPLSEVWKRIHERYGA